MVACYTAAIVFPPTALICGAIGLAFAVPGIYNLAQNTGRLFDYMSTGQYDSDVFGKYMTSNFVSGVMYTIWLSGMLPGFTKNLANVKSMATEAIKKIQITKGQLGITTREALLAEYNLIKRYVQYYSKEITLDGTFDTIARFSGKTNLIIPHASRVLLLTATQIRNRSPRIFQYSDMLAVTRASMAAVK